MEYSPPEQQDLRDWIDKLYAQSDLEIIRIISKHITDMRKEEAHE